MKQLKLLLLLLAALPLALNANPIQDAWNSGITNGAAGGGFWWGKHSHIISYDLVYNIAKNDNGLSAGLIVGGDYLYAGKNHVFNDVKGGFAVSYQLKPFEALGATNAFARNTFVTISAGDCVATPRDSSVGVGNIAFTDIDWYFTIWNHLQIHIDPALQTRTGQGDIFSGRFFGVQAFLAYKVTF